MEIDEHDKNRHFRNEKEAGLRYWGCAGQLLANFLPVA